MARVALLDVNVLLALVDPDHVHHDLAHDWFAGQRPHGWATCPLTETAFVRVLSHRRYGAGLRPADAVAALAAFKASGQHHFWSDTVSLTDEALFRADRIPTARYVTGAYLLALARKRLGVLATFDAAVPITAVDDGENYVTIIRILESSNPRILESLIP